MPGVAAFLAALVTAAGHSAQAPTARAALDAAAPHAKVILVRTSRPTKLRSCSTTQSQPTETGRKIAPVACEQPPKSQLGANAASGGLSSFFGR